MEVMRRMLCTAHVQPAISVSTLLHIPCIFASCVHPPSHPPSYTLPLPSYTHHVCPPPHVPFSHTAPVMCDQVTCVKNYVHPDIVMLRLRFDGCYMHGSCVISRVVLYFLWWHNPFVYIWYLLKLWFHE